MSGTSTRLGPTYPGAPTRAPNLNGFVPERRHDQLVRRRCGVQDPDAAADRHDLRRGRGPDQHPVRRQRRRPEHHRDQQSGRQHRPDGAGDHHRQCRRHLDQGRRRRPRRNDALSKVDYAEYAIGEGEWQQGSSVHAGRGGPRRALPKRRQGRQPRGHAHRPGLRGPDGTEHHPGFLPDDYTEGSWTNHDVTVGSSVTPATTARPSPRAPQPSTWAPKAPTSSTARPATGRQRGQRRRHRTDRQDAADRSTAGRTGLRPQRLVRPAVLGPASLPRSRK